MLSGAVRSYILSHTTGVFERSYQPKRVREDLASLAFGAKAGRNDELFGALRNMSLTRDAGAPIEVSVEDHQKLEERNDMKRLRAAVDIAYQRGDSEEERQNKKAIESLTTSLSRSQLLEKRTEYFKRVDRLGAQGRPTMASAGENGLGKALMRKQGRDGATDIARFLQTCNEDIDNSSVDQRSKPCMELLVEYLANRPTPKTPPPESGIPKAQLGGRQKSVDDAADDKYDPDPALPLTGTKGPQGQRLPEQPHCLLGCGPFRDRGTCLRRSLLVVTYRGSQLTRQILKRF